MPPLPSCRQASPPAGLVVAEVARRPAVRRVAVLRVGVSWAAGSSTEDSWAGASCAADSLAGVSWAGDSFAGDSLEADVPALLRLRLVACAGVFAVALAVVFAAVFAGPFAAVPLAGDFSASLAAAVRSVVLVVRPDRFCRRRTMRCDPSVVVSR
ncbi:hypothetical protein [Ornithinimicrobium kibberense]|uniref:hypothetical protein n=1 Tax=Ornithinimicrobium kibberense TaxID=282060 RepID=UPI00361D4A8E